MSLLKHTTALLFVFVNSACQVSWCALQVRRRIRSAVMKSHGTEGDMLVRAVANAFFDEEHGLHACPTGYLLAPVSYSVVAQYIRQETDWVPLQI